MVRSFAENLNTPFFCRTEKESRHFGGSHSSPHCDHISSVPASRVKQKQVLDVCQISSRASPHSNHVSEPQGYLAGTGARWRPRFLESPTPNKPIPAYYTQVNHVFLSFSSLPHRHHRRRHRRPLRRASHPPQLRRHARVRANRRLRASLGVQGNRRRRRARRQFRANGTQYRPWGAAERYFGQPLGHLD